VLKPVSVNHPCRSTVIPITTDDMNEATQILYRESRQSDIPEMAEVRAGDWGSEEYWRNRILAYLTHQLHPREALLPRVSFVAVEGERIVGLIAGHLTRRHGCDGELEWISVRPTHRNRGVASQLVIRLAEWFLAHDVYRVCVDVEPSNQVARRFYAHHGAQDLKPHWMVWQDIALALQPANSRQRMLSPDSTGNPSQ
jgi:GNAT superfamily N-acetyltransferase